MKQAEILTIVSDRFGVTKPCAFNWLKSGLKYPKRRIDAALAGKRADFTPPVEGYAVYLEQRHGTSLAEVSRFYGYGKGTIYGLLARVPETKRVWTMIDYFVGANAHAR
jgi:hypothetical protein